MNRDLVLARLMAGYEAAGGEGWFIQDTWDSGGSELYVGPDILAVFIACEALGVMDDAEDEADAMDLVAKAMQTASDQLAAVADALRGGPPDQEP